MYCLDKQFTDAAYGVPWFVVQNGVQVDVHARITPNGKQPRDITVFSDEAADEAARLVSFHNHNLKTRDTEARDHEWEIRQLHG